MQGMEEMGTRFEAVREKEEARTKVREEAKRKERERVEKEAAKAAAALVTAAAASAAMEASEEPRRSGRKRPTPRSQARGSLFSTVIFYCYFSDLFLLLFLMFQAHWYRRVHFRELLCVKVWWGRIMLLGRATINTPILWTFLLGELDKLFLGVFSIEVCPLNVFSF